MKETTNTKVQIGEIYSPGEIITSKDVNITDIIHESYGISDARGLSSGSYDNSDAIRELIKSCIDEGLTADEIDTKIKAFDTECDEELELDDDEHAFHHCLLIYGNIDEEGFLWSSETWNVEPR